MANSGKVLIAAPVHPVLINGLTDRGYECVVHESISQQSAYGLVADCVGIITSTRLQLERSLLDAAPKLEWIGRMGSGMEVIDLEYAAARGIKCFGSPEGNCNAVGEHALGMLLTLTRKIAWSHTEIRHGQWLREENRGTELEGKTVAIIGYGHTGHSFARKMQGFDTCIMAYDKYKPEGIPVHIKNCKDHGGIFEEADIVSFHVPLQPDTIHYFNDDFVTKMHKPFILINTSRGMVVDTAALYRGIKQGKVIGACLDVLEQEPLSAMDTSLRAMVDELVQLPNVVITPHIAGYTFEALYKMSNALLTKVTASI